jgi:hypothetical protein
MLQYVPLSSSNTLHIVCLTVGTVSDEPRYISTADLIFSHTLYMVSSQLKWISGKTLCIYLKITFEIVLKTCKKT